MDYTIENVIKSIQENPWTMIAVDINCVVKNCVSLEKIPTSTTEFHEVLRLGNEKEWGVFFLPQNKNITETEVRKRILQSVEDLKYSDAHDLKPGINIPFRYNRVKQLMLFAGIIGIAFILWVAYKILGLASTIGSIIVFMILYLTKKGFQKRVSK